MAHYMEIGVDDEVYEIEVRFEDIYYKCRKCGKRQYGGFYFEAEAEMRHRSNVEVETKHLCLECYEEEQKRAAPLRVATYITKQISMQAGKELPVETAQEWLRTGDVASIKNCINQFVEQARSEQRKARRPITMKNVIQVDRNRTRF